MALYKQPNGSAVQKRGQKLKSRIAERKLIKKYGSVDAARAKAGMGPQAPEPTKEEIKAEKAKIKKQDLEKYKREVASSNATEIKPTINVSASNVNTPYFNQAIQNTGKGISGYELKTNPNTMGYDQFYQPLVGDRDFRFDYTPQRVFKQNDYQGQSGIDPDFSKTGSLYDSNSKISMFSGKNISADFNLPLYKSKYGTMLGGKNFSLGLKGSATIGETLSRKKPEYISQINNIPIGLNPNAKWLKPGTGMINQKGVGAVGSLGVSAKFDAIQDRFTYGNFKGNVGAGVVGSTLGDQKLLPYGEIGISKTLFNTDKFKSQKGGKIKSQGSFGVDAFFNKRQALTPNVIQSKVSGQTQGSAGINLNYKNKKTTASLTISRNTRNNLNTNVNVSIKRVLGKN